MKQQIYTADRKKEDRVDADAGTAADGNATEFEKEQDKLTVLDQEWKDKHKPFNNVKSSSYDQPWKDTAINN